MEIPDLVYIEALQNDAKRYDSILVVSKEGCYFIGDKLVHSDTCLCGEDL